MTSAFARSNNLRMSIFLLDSFVYSFEVDIHDDSRFFGISILILDAEFLAMTVFYEIVQKWIIVVPRIQFIPSLGLPSLDCHVSWQP